MCARASRLSARRAAALLNRPPPVAPSFARSPYAFLLPLPPPPLPPPQRYAGDAEGRGGIYNFVTKRGLCAGDRAKISWTQVETGSAITWKYPSVILKGDASVGEFYSVALTNNMQQADTGTKMVHVGKNTRSRIVSKGISAGQVRRVCFVCVCCVCCVWGGVGGGGGMMGW